jgi:hypothetical protein
MYEKYELDEKYQVLGWRNAYHAALAECFNQSPASSSEGRERMAAEILVYMLKTGACPARAYSQLF